MTEKQRAFLDKIGPMAAADMKKTGILASLTIAQAILESGWGTSRLTVQDNNLFGMKGAYNGASATYDTKEWDGGKYITVKAAFRKYPSWAESVADHSGLFLRADRYKNLRGCTDYKKACQYVREDGYATDPSYTAKLVQLIEGYNLTQYDTTGGITVTEQELRAKVVSIAQSFLGCKESDGSHRKIIDLYNSHTPRARGYAVKYTDAWCSTFASAVAIKAGLTDIIPTECGCERHIALFRGLGRWQENDAHKPAPGDYIFYDWQDNGVGDCTGAADHIGIVVSVTGSTIKVIEGNINDAVGYRNIQVNGRYIRGYGLPDYASKATGKPTASASSAVESVTQATQKNPATLESAREFDKDIAGPYKTTANLYLRTGAGKEKAALCIMPKGATARNYGFYNIVGGTKWLLVQYVKDGKTYTGYSSSAYLTK